MRVAGYRHQQFIQLFSLAMFVKKSEDTHSKFLLRPRQSDRVEPRFLCISTFLTKLRNDFKNCPKLVHPISSVLNPRHPRRVRDLYQRIKSNSARDMSN